MTVPAVRGLDLFNMARRSSASSFHAQASVWSASSASRPRCLSQSRPCLHGGRAGTLVVQAHVQPQAAASDALDREIGPGAGVGIAAIIFKRFEVIEG